MVNGNSNKAIKYIVDYVFVSTFERSNVHECKKNLKQIYVKYGQQMFS